jgi:tetratricopeptide (TPR) repeat protein
VLTLGWRMKLEGSILMRLALALLALSCVIGLARPHHVLAADGQAEGKFAAEVDSLNEESNRLYREGRYAEAIPLVERALYLREKNLGPEHPDTGTSLNNLALLYDEIGAYRKAELLLQRALAIAEKIFGPDHRDTATCIANLAALYRATGAYAKAEPLYQRALAIRENALGPEDPDTASSLNGLAAFYQDLGVNEKAEVLYKRALTINEKVLGAEHPDTATSLNNLAVLYKRNGSYAEAESMYLRALTIRAKALGPEHADTARSLNDLGMLYLTIGEYAKPELLLQRALAINEKQRGPWHLEVALNLNNLSGLYFMLGANDKGLPLLERSLAITEKVLGAEHPEVAMKLDNLAGFYQVAGDREKTEMLLKRAIAITEKVFGAEHPEAARHLNNLAGVYDNPDDYAMVEPMYQRVLAIREKVLGARHPEVASSLRNLAALYIRKGELATAAPMLDRALLIAASANEAELSVAVFASLLTLRKTQGQIPSAIFYGKNAVNTIQNIRRSMQPLDQMLKRFYGEKQSFVYRRLAELLVDEGRFAEAQRVLEMLKEEEYFDFVRRDSQADNRTKRISPSPIEEPWERRYQEIAKQLVALGEELRSLERTKSEMRTVQEQTRIQRLRGDLEAAQRHFAAVLEEMEADFKKLRDKRKEELAARHFDVERMGLVSDLGPGTVLLQYIVLPDAIRILLTTGTVQKAYKIAQSEKKLKESAFALQSRLRDPRLDPRPAAKALYDVLIAPVAADLAQANTKTLMVSLDGFLRYLPLAALYDGQHYLV